jgi:hypothetical protein
MDDVEVIKPSFKLKRKVGPAAGTTFNAKVIEKAEKSIASMSGDYLKKVSIDISGLRSLTEQAQGGKQDCRSVLEKIANQAREIKGQGGTFGFPLLTRISDSLYQFTNPMTTLNQKRATVISAHLDAMLLVVSQQIKGDGGVLGQELCKSLDTAIEKFGGE